VKLVEDSPNGFILFSLGTVANTTAMPEKWKGNNPRSTAIKI